MSSTPEITVTLTLNRHSSFILGGEVRLIRPPTSHNAQPNNDCRGHLARDYLLKRLAGWQLNERHLCGKVSAHASCQPPVFFFTKKIEFPQIFGEQLYED
jgi:hypothetical protein